MKANTKFKFDWSSIKIKEYNSIDECPEQDWQGCVRDHVFLSKPYLQSLEQANSEKLKYRYLLLYNDQERCSAVIYLQYVWFKAIQDKHADEMAFFARHIKQRILGDSGIRVMLCGNAFATGAYGFALADGCEEEEFLGGLCEFLKQRLKTDEAIPSSMAGIKELWKPIENGKNYACSKGGFHGFEMDQCMFMALHPQWTSLSDYAACLQAKYRTRLNSVLKKSKGLHCRSLSSDEIRTYHEPINKLFWNVLSKSKFLLGELDVQTFALWKAQLEEKFHFIAWFRDDMLIAFQTAFVNGDQLDAQYVGFDYNFNQESAIYQRMLYQFIELALTLRLKGIQLGRSANEMKSTLGAQAQSAFLYTRHKKSLSNQLVGPIISAIRPVPFKDHQPYLKQFNQSWNPSPLPEGNEVPINYLRPLAYNATH